MSKRQIPWTWMAMLTLVTALGVGGSAALTTNREPTPLVATRVYPDIQRPLRIATDSKGRVLVLSATDHGVLLFDDHDSLQCRIGRIGIGPGGLFRPTDLAVDQADFVWVADQGNNRVVRFGPTGKYISSFAVEAPLALAALPNDEVAVVSTFDLELIRVYSARDGRVVRNVGTIDQRWSSSAAQNAYFSRGRVRAVAGELCFWFRALPDPAIRWYDFQGRMTRELRPRGSQLEDLENAARATIRTAVREGSHRYSGTLNAVAADPVSGCLWVAPSAPVVYVYSRSGLKQGEYALTDASGHKYGPSDIWLGRDGRGYFVAGSVCFRFQVPNAPIQSPTGPVQLKRVAK